jgi:hypothetical protein
MILKMKRFGALILTILLTTPFAFSQEKKGKEDMVFDKTVNGVTAHDFGSIVFGANGKVNFDFTNKGTKDLVITDVKSSCGCTVPTWTKEPIKPGKKGTIELLYNTQLAGAFNKTVVVYSNANNSPVRLEIRGKVTADAGQVKPGQVIGVENKASKEVLDEQAYINKSTGSSNQESAAVKAAQEQSFRKLTDGSASSSTTSTNSTSSTSSTSSKTTTKKK